MLYCVGFRGGFKVLVPLSTESTGHVPRKQKPQIPKPQIPGNDVAIAENCHEGFANRSNGQHVAYGMTGHTGCVSNSPNTNRPVAHDDGEAQTCALNGLHTNRGGHGYSATAGTPPRTRPAKRMHKRLHWHYTGFGILGFGNIFKTLLMDKILHTIIPIV